MTIYRLYKHETKHKKCVTCGRCWLQYDQLRYSSEIIFAQGDKPPEEVRQIVSAVSKCPLEVLTLEKV